jgi:putative peptidoglycan lipid II flippase
LVSFAAVAMGMLNAEERYGAPALAPALFNLVAILWAGMLWALGLPPHQVALGWAVGTLLGGAAQFLVQVPELRGQGWRFRPEWAPGDPGIRRVLGLMAPATVGLAAVQVNIFVNSIFASHEPGAVSWLNYAFRILYLPIGVFGVSVGTIATSGLARRAATGDLEGLRETLRRSLRTMAFLTIPSTVGLLAVGLPVVRLLYQRGRFGEADTEATAAALACYSLGMVAYTGVKVLAPAFYALNAPRVPLLASVSAVATNLVVNLTLYRWLGFRSVALGTSLGALVNVGVLLVVFERRLGGLRGQGLARALAGMTGLSAAMGLIAAGTAWGLTGWLGTRGLPAQLMTGLVPVAVGAVAYGAGARLAGLPEARELLALLRPRARARRPVDE